MKWPSALLLPAAVAAMTGPRPAPPAPHVVRDTIYALAVDSTAYREYPFVYLLDEAVIRYDADGRGSRTYHQVIQILKPSGVAQWAERSVSYQPDREKAIVNWMRVVKPSGEVVSEKPSQSQTTDVPASQFNPVYTTTRVERYSLSNVTPGTLVDISTTIETIKPAMAMDWQTGWNVTLATPGMRSNLVVDLPAGYAPHIEERHLDFARTDVTRGGRRILQWATRNVKPATSEIFAPDSSVPFMQVRLSAAIGWKDIGRWYNDLSKDRYVLTPAVTAAIDSVVRSAHSQADTLVALHRWIAKDLRYVSISLGIGGYQPRFPEATVGTGYGDCKDKATLFIAAARHLGITAYPVLLNASGGSSRDLPAIEQFNHVIAAVERRGVPGYTYVDLTTFSSPLGLVEPSYQDGFGLVVLRDGTTREITFPKDSATRFDQVLRGELTADGHVTGTVSVTRSGPREAAARAPYAEPPDSAQRANLKRSAPRVFPGAVIDTVIIADVNNPQPGPFYTVAFHDGVAGKPAGSIMILSVPAGIRGPGAQLQFAIDELQRADKRTLPIDAARVPPGGPSHSELHLVLPAGWTAQLPPAVHVKSVFGSYDAEYSQVGRELRIVHDAEAGHGVVAAADVGTVSEWLKSIAKDDAEYIPLSKGP